MIDFFLHWEGGYLVYDIVSLDIEATKSFDRSSGCQLQKNIMESVGCKANPVMRDLPDLDRNISEDGTCGWQMHETHFKVKQSKLQKIVNLESVFNGLSIAQNADVCEQR